MAQILTRYLEPEVLIRDVIFSIKDSPQDVMPAIFVLSEDYQAQVALFF